MWLKYSFKHDDDDDDDDDEKLFLFRLQPHIMKSANYCKFQSPLSTETALLKPITHVRETRTS